MPITDFLRSRTVYNALHPRHHVSSTRVFEDRVVKILELRNVQ